jgi:hypothetical protein
LQRLTPDWVTWKSGSKTKFPVAVIVGSAIRLLLLLLIAHGMCANSLLDLFLVE